MENESPSPQESNQSTVPTSAPDTNTILVILLLIFVYPVGLVLMWLLMKHWPTWLKLLIMSPIFLAALGVFAAIALIAIDPAAQLKKAQEVKQESRQIQEQDKTTVSNTPAAPVDETVIPSDWTYQASNKCGVSLAVPPKKEPYFIPNTSKSETIVGDQGGYWIFEESTAFTEDSQFTNSARVYFTNPDAQGSGYMAGMVLLQCADNTKDYTSQSLATELVQKYNNTSPQQEFSAQITGSKEYSSKTFTEVTFSGGMNDGFKSFFLVENGKIYELQVVSMSTNPFIKSTTDQIANLIKFQ